MIFQSRFPMNFSLFFKKKKKNPVTECKFTCPTHSEVQQTRTSNLGVEKVLLQGHARRTGGSCPQKTPLPKRFQKSIFKGQKREGGLRVCDHLVHNSLVDGEVTEQLTLSIHKRQKVWGATAHDIKWLISSTWWCF